MLDQLPAEIIYQISGHFSSATAIINLSLVNRRLYQLMSQNDYSGFKYFVERSFPTIRMTPHWKGNACKLTTRARAFAKAAFVARIIAPDSPGWMSQDRWGSFSNAHRPNRIPTPTIGHAPVIDSYEDWNAATPSYKHTVVAWGAAGQVVIQKKEADSTSSATHTFEEDHLPQNDVMDLHLLRPGQKKSEVLEEVIIRRANGQITRLEQNLRNELHVVTDFITTDGTAQCLDVSRGRTPLVAACGPGSIEIFNGGAQDRQSSPVSVSPSPGELSHRYRLRCAKFLSDDCFATAVQFVEGTSVAPINIYRITPDGLHLTLDSSVLSKVGQTSRDSTMRICSNSIAPLDDVGTLAGRPGEVFLSGCSDSIIRLHDIRAPESFVTKYTDGIDDGQILSVLPMGHERFLAAGADNACIKVFDLRMPRAIMYSHIAANGVPVTSESCQPHPTENWSIQMRAKSDRGLNILLGIRFFPVQRLSYQGPRDFRRFPRYRGSVYSLSSPSPASPTVYAGIERHVVQLDFVSTDDLQSRGSSLSKAGFNMPSAEDDDVLNLSCYERPRPGFESTDPVLLMTQLGLDIVKKRDYDYNQGWDQRLVVSDNWRSSRHS